MFDKVLLLFYSRCTIALKLEGVALYVSEYREAFNLFDKNKDNVISAKELGTVMRALGQSPTDSDIRTMINHADLNSM